MSTAERIKNDRFEVVDTDIVESINSSSMKISDLYIGSISSGIKTLNPDTNISMASQMIRTDPMLPGFCILNNGELLRGCNEKSARCEAEKQINAALPGKQREPHK